MGYGKSIGSLEKKVEKLENFIKSKDLWESYLHF